MRSILSVLPLLLCVTCGAPLAARATPPDPARLVALGVRSPATSSSKSAALLQVDGKVAYEGYFNGADAETLHDVRSASKSVTALLVGAAIGEGRLAGVQAKVYDSFPDFTARHQVDPRLRATTVQDLLTMSSLWECDDENPFSAGHEERMYVSEKWLDFALALPVKGFAPWMQRPENSPHCRAFAYCTANSFVLGAVLERATGQPGRLRRACAGAAAGHHPEPVESFAGGNRHGGGGTRYRTRDLARIGQLVLDGGRWQGGSWYRRTTSRQ